jgi:hypothetical protein
MWLSDEDPLKAKELERIPLVEYWFKLNKKLADYKKAKQKDKSSKLGKSGRTNNY